MNSYIRIAAAQMFPRDMVCLRNVSVDTLNKGDTEDNNNNKFTFRTFTDVMQL